MSQRIHFIANCIYSNLIGGGDIHLFRMAEGALRSGYHVEFIGGTALKEHLTTRGIQAPIRLTDSRRVPGIDINTLGGQLRLLIDYFGRFVRTLPLLRYVERDSVAYSTTDYWYDSIPTVLCKARGKLMILGMDAPTLRQIIFRLRPDVKPSRIASIYYWLSQNLSLRLFRFCKSKKLLYVHPSMKPRLLSMGYKESELVFISNGFDMDIADSVPPQPRSYDVAWVGRVHVQKGIDDLLSTLAFLSKRLPDFRAVIIGRVQDALAPRIAELGLSKCVDFSGFATDEEKFRLLKSSQVFLMPSRYESWGIVMAEAVACGARVVAYDLEPYRAIFGDLVEYVRCFDREAFERASEAAVLAMRAAKEFVKADELEGFKNVNSWATAQRIFNDAVESL